MTDEFTAKFKVDVSDLKKNISDAVKSIKEANLAFKAETAGMEKWSNNADGLGKKLNSLKTILENQKTILASYQQQLEKQQAAYAENGKRADELKAKLQQLSANGVSKSDAEYQKYEKSLKAVIKEQANNEKACDDLRQKILEEKAAIGQTESQINKYTTAQKNMEKESSSLTSTVSRQQKQLDELKREYVNVVAAEGKNSASAKALAGQISSLSGDLKENKSKMTEAEKEANKLDKSVDELGDSADDAGNKFDGLGSKMAAGLKAGVAAVGAAAAAVGAAATAAVGKLVKDSVAQFADYQQLVGGVETLFGTGGKSIYEYADSVGKSVTEVEDEYNKLQQAQTAVLKNANNAYKTAGLSANAYIETVTNFSASLIASLDGDTSRAVQYADKALTDMSDNANKMGTDMQSIQNAYQGFAKQNYTMLDNLKLGYGGTKTEMERLISDAEKLDSTFVATRDENGKIAMSYADIVDAIHIVQTNMGITGTTADEANRTISGSLNAMKAAGQNLITGLADGNADVKTLTSNFVQSIKTMLINIIPVVRQALLGIGELISSIAPMIAQELPTLIELVLPSLIDTIFNLVDTLGNVFPDVVSTLMSLFTKSILPRLPDLLRTGMNMVFALIEGILSPENINLLVDAAFQVVNDFVKFLTDNIGRLVEVAIDLVMTLAEALLNPEAISALIDGALQLVMALGNALIENLPALIDRLPALVEGIVTGIVENAPKIMRAAWELTKALWKALLSPEMLNTLWDAGVKILESIFDGFLALGRELDSYMGEVFGDIGNWFNQNVTAPIGKCFSDMWKGLKDGAKGAWDGIKNVFGSVANWFKDIFSNAWQKVKDVFSAGGKIFTGIKDGIVDAFKKVVNGIIDGINKVIKLPFDGINAALQKIKDISILGLKPFDWISTIAVPQIPKLATGGVLRKGQVGLLEGSGAEAVVPLDKNKEWVRAVAADMIQSLRGDGLSPGLSNVSNARTTTFTQIINAPKAPSRIELYRQTKNLLSLAEGGII